MSSTLSDLMDTLFAQGKMMIGDMQTINDQLFLIMDLTFSLIDDLMNNERGLDDFYQDVSREDIEKKTEGKVNRSKNSGPVQGDINVGGISGSMAIDLKLDPEGDFNIDKNIPLNAVYQTSAIIQQCENSGRIMSKKNNVGGIVGNMDLGYILDCVATDVVESIDGDYVGGIAGRSGPIVSSYAKCTLRWKLYRRHCRIWYRNNRFPYPCKVERSNACVGAIAGDVENNGVIKMNTLLVKPCRYRWYKLQEAEPISYKELILKEDVPSVLKELNLIL